MSTAALPRVTVVVAKHRGAVPLVAAQRAVAIGMICSEEDGKEVRSGPDGACVVGAHAQGRPDAGVWWNDLGAPSRLVPSMVRDRTGGVRLATAGEEGRLSVANRLSPTGAFHFGAWNAV
ncbi:hypothetical protein ACWHA3_10615 [Streptomyces cyaneofuscatus]